MILIKQIQVCIILESLLFSYLHPTASTSCLKYFRVFLRQPRVASDNWTGRKVPPEHRAEWIVSPNNTLVLINGWNLQPSTILERKMIWTSEPNLHDDYVPWLCWLCWLCSMLIFWGWIIWPTVFVSHPYFQPGKATNELSVSETSPLRRKSGPGVPTVRSPVAQLSVTRVYVDLLPPWHHWGLRTGNR